MRTFSLHRIAFSILAIVCFCSLARAQDSASPPALSASLQAVVDEATDSVEQTIVSDSVDALNGIMVPYRAELAKAARKHHVPIALLAAFCQEESKFNQYATRQEPAYEKNPKVRALAKKWSKQHGGIPTALTESRDRSRSMGPMQVMGEVAREQGYEKRYLAELYAAEDGIDQGAIRLRTYLNKYGRDTLAAISAYNQGNARTRHGHFENARYVYRVAVAWKHYDALFHPKHTSRYDLQESDNQTRFRNLRPDSAALSADRDSAVTKARLAIADQNNDSGPGPHQARYAYRARHADPLADLRVGEGQQTRNGFGIAIRDGLLAGFGAVAIAGSLFGLGYCIFRYERRWSRHAAGVLQPEDGSIHTFDSASQTSADPSGTLYLARHRDDGKGLDRSHAIGQVGAVSFSRKST